MSQTETILAMLKRGPVTQMDALQEAGCMRLPARINELRQQGISIETEYIKTPTGKTIGQYKLKEADHGGQAH